MKSLPKNLLKMEKIWIITSSLLILTHKSIKLSVKNENMSFKPGYMPVKILKIHFNPGFPAVF